MKIMLNVIDFTQYYITKYQYFTQFYIMFIILYFQFFTTDALMTIEYSTY